MVALAIFQLWWCAVTLNWAWIWSITAWFLLDLLQAFLIILVVLRKVTITAACTLVKHWHSTYKFDYMMDWSLHLEANVHLLLLAAGTSCFQIWLGTYISWATHFIHPARERLQISCWIDEWKNQTSFFYPEIYVQQLVRIDWGPLRNSSQRLQVSHFFTDVN